MYRLIAFKTIMDNNKKIMSIDAETDGLWGNPFAIAAIVYEKNEPEYFGGVNCTYEDYVKYGNSDGSLFGEYYVSQKIILCLPDTVVKDEWVKENVLPTLSDVTVTHTNYDKMLRDFATFYLKNKERCEIICHMGHIVEAFLFREMHRIGAIGDWDAPYPLFDVSGNLQAAGFDPTSVDLFIKENGLKVSNSTTNNPLYDCEVAAKAYLLLNIQKNNKKCECKKCTYRKFRNYGDQRTCICTNMHRFRQKCADVNKNNNCILFKTI